MSLSEIIGLMSGTSMDGLDIAHVRFSSDEHSNYSFELIHYGSSTFPENLKQKLVSASTMPTPQLIALDKELGRFYAQCVNDFISSNSIEKKTIKAIASHGQTIFHQPANGFTLQIGCGSTISYFTGLPVINDFRSKDIIAGGQGAPLVPIGDFSLFTDKAEAFLNIGGFANISFKQEGVIKAFDICPGNLPLNKLVSAKGMDFDRDGEIAGTGEISFFLLDMLNSLDYYQHDGPKSLGTEWLDEHFYPLLKFDKDIESNLRTVVEHIAIQIASVLNKNQIKSVFVTGGGALNTFLIERVSHYFKGIVHIPEKQIIDFKEAIIFAFLGQLYLDGKPNNIPSVTGASHAVIGGVLHIPN